MTTEDELATLISQWFEDQDLATEWKIDWGTHDTSRPEIIRNSSMHGIIIRISGTKVIIAHHAFRNSCVEFDATSPRFFDRLKDMLKRIEEIDDI